jgi:hypothetical protein
MGCMMSNEKSLYHRDFLQLPVSDAWCVFPATARPYFFALESHLVSFQIVFLGVPFQAVAEWKYCGTQIMWRL